MELVYLWVEKYKNIEKHGFNFSPRFEVEYDEEKKELKKIEEDKEYKNFFSDKLNITTIVGENGSGKSSILKMILYLFSTNRAKEVTDSQRGSSEGTYLLVVFENESYRYLTNNITPNKNDIFEMYKM